MEQTDMEQKYHQYPDGKPQGVSVRTSGGSEAYCSMNNEISIKILQLIIEYGENTYSSRSDVVATIGTSVVALPLPTGVNPEDSSVSHHKKHDQKGSNA
jgi:hypothetical protein